MIFGVVFGVADTGVSETGGVIVSGIVFVLVFEMDDGVMVVLVFVAVFVNSSSVSRWKDNIVEFHSILIELGTDFMRQHDWLENFAELSCFDQVGFDTAGCKHVDFPFINLCANNR